MPAGFQRTAHHRLVNVAEPDVQLTQHFQDFRLVPGTVAYFEHQRVFHELHEQSAQVVAIFRRILKGPGKLQQQRPEAVHLHQRIQALFEQLFVTVGGVTTVGETLPKLGRELEVLVMLDAPHPGLCHFGAKGTVERRIDLERVEECGQVLRLTEASRLWSGVDDSVPVGVGPTRRTDSNLVSRRGVPATNDWTWWVMTGTVYARATPTAVRNTT